MAEKNMQNIEYPKAGTEVSLETGAKMLNNAKYPEHGTKVILDSRKEKLAVPCEVYSRVVGYYRPVQSWNEGKQEEFKDRKEFVVK